MEKNTITLTRKIQIHLDTQDKAERQTYYEKLFSWQNLVFRGANMILSHQYIQEHLKDLIYLKDEIRVKLADHGKDAEGIFNTSRMNTTYKILSANFKGQLPSDIISNLNRTLIKTFNTERAAYWKGDRSLRNYKKDMPIPFSSIQIKLRNDEKGKDFKLQLFNIPFRTYLGKDRTDKRVLLQRVLAAELKVCSSSIKIIKGKIFLLLTMEMPKQQHNLREHIIAEVSLSIEHPITLSIDENNYYIGNKEEFLYRRLAIQSARHRLQKAAAYHSGGHGRKRKLKKLDYFTEKEKRYVDSKLHLYSRKLIDQCLKYQAGTLLFVNQTQKEEIAKEDGFLLRNWSYYGLLEKIKYKALIAGINVIME